MTELHTDRLLLRHWRAADEAPFAALNADPVVMQFMAGRLTRSESDACVRQARDGLSRHGFGLWALELKAAGGFIGCVGLATVHLRGTLHPVRGDRLAPGALELGTRLRHRGGACLPAPGLRELGLREIVAFTVPANARSGALMQRLGMQHDPNGDFEHPRLPEGHPLRQHVLYRLNFRAWAATQA